MNVTIYVGNVKKAEKQKYEDQSKFQRKHCAWRDERKIAKYITAFIPHRYALRMAVIDRVSLIREMTFYRRMLYQQRLQPSPGICPTPLFGNVKCHYGRLYASWSLETQLCLNGFHCFGKNREKKIRAVRSECEINSWNVDYVRCTESCMQRALRVRKSILYDESGIL